MLRRVTVRMGGQMEEIEHRAPYDQLTGLANRNLFRDREQTPQQRHYEAAPPPLSARTPARCTLLYELGPSGFFEPPEIRLLPLQPVRSCHAIEERPAPGHQCRQHDLADEVFKPSRVLEPSCVHGLVAGRLY